MSTLAEIEEVIETLPVREQEELFAFLALRLRPDPLGTRIPTSTASQPGNHSVLDIPPVHVGRVLRPLAADDDLLGEMLEARK